MRSLGKCLLAAVLVSALAGRADAASITLYGVTGAGDGASSLYTIDTTTGAATLIGATGFSHMTGLDIDPITDIMYGVVDSGFSGGAKLVTVDKTTGAATLVGDLGNGGGVPDISFDSTGQLYGWNEGGDLLMTIDKNTGASVDIGPFTSSARTGLAFDSSDNGYMKSGASLYSIVPAGSSTFLGGLSGSGATPRDDLEFDPTGILYTILSTGIGSGRDSFLGTIDIGAMNWTNIGDMGVPGMSALAVDAEEVPEPATLTLLAVGLGSLGAARRRRAARKSTDA